jgi:hypothetical protein
MATEDQFTVMIAVDKSGQAMYAFDCEYNVDVLANCLLGITDGVY